MPAITEGWDGLWVTALRHLLFKLLYPAALAGTMAGLYGLWWLLNPRRRKGAKRWPLTLDGIIRLGLRRRRDQGHESALREHRPRTKR